MCDLLLLGGGGDVFGDRGRPASACFGASGQARATVARATAVTASIATPADLDRHHGGRLKAAQVAHGVGDLEVVQVAGGRLVGERQGRDGAVLEPVVRVDGRGGLVPATPQREADEEPEERPGRGDAGHRQRRQRPAEQEPVDAKGRRRGGGRCHADRQTPQGEQHLLPCPHWFQRTRRSPVSSPASSVRPRAWPQMGTDYHRSDRLSALFPGNFSTSPEPDA